MREIKFRALIEYQEGKVWEYYNTLSMPVWSDGVGCRIVEKDLQFTGLLDKNGNEIYEGDILGGMYGEQDYEDDDLVAIKGKISYGTGQFEVSFGVKTASLNDINGGGIWWTVGNNIREWGYKIINIEVVGNIYQNPDLLNQTK